MKIKEKPSKCIGTSDGWNYNTLIKVERFIDTNKGEIMIQKSFADYQINTINDLLLMKMGMIIK